MSSYVVRSKVIWKLTDIYVDGDACPVREEIYRVAVRLRLNVFVVSNGSRRTGPGFSVCSIQLCGLRYGREPAAESMEPSFGPTGQCRIREPLVVI